MEAMEAVELKVDGMSCGSCVKAASSALGAVPGVESVDVRLDTGTATVRGREVTAQVQALLTALAGAGYHARAAGTPSQASFEQPVRDKCGSGRESRSGCCCGR